MDGKEKKEGCGCGCSDKKSSKKWIYIGGFLVVAAVAATWYFLFRKKALANGQ